MTLVLLFTNKQKNAQEVEDEILALLINDVQYGWADACEDYCHEIPSDELRPIFNRAVKRYNAGE